MATLPLQANCTNSGGPATSTALAQPQKAQYSLYLHTATRLGGRGRTQGHRLKLALDVLDGAEDGVDHVLFGVVLNVATGELHGLLAALVQPVGDLRKGEAELLRGLQHIVR